MKKILTVLVIVISIMSFCGCSKDDEPSLGLQELYGTWYRYLREESYKVNTHTQFAYIYYQKLGFSTNGDLWVCEEYGNSYIDHVSGLERYTYTVMGNQLTVTNTENNDSETYPIIIDGNCLIIGKTVFSREKIK